MTQLIDNYERPITYLRLSVTDRCNLRCHYCMPRTGVEFVDKNELLSYEELERMCRVLSEMGISKVRITGGEPFVRKDIIRFLTTLTQMDGVETVTITTNGVLTKPYLNDLKNLGINQVNLSLDTFDPERFKQITGKDDFEKVRDTLFAMLEQDFEVKLNAVIMDGVNTEDILPLARLSINLPVSVRFIEEMPFNGTERKVNIAWNYKRILEEIQTVFPSIAKAHTPKNSTAVNYKIPGSKGDIGIIAAHSRTFCGTCNRIRVNAEGQMRTCLYGHNTLDIRQLLRDNATDKAISSAIRHAISNRARDGFEAEKLRNKSRLNESMTKIGG